MSLLGVGSGMPGLVLYKSLQSSQTKRFEEYAERPTVNREVEYFAAEIKNIESADDLVDNYRLKQFVLQAFGLEELQNSNGLLKRVLTDDLGAEDAFAYRMRDPRFVEIASALRLDRGVETITSDAAIGEIIERYLVQGFELDIGEQNIATRQALYFKRSIKDVENVFQIMADPTMKEVVRVAVGLPEQINQIDFDKQTEQFESKVDVDRLSDEEYIEDLVTKFLIRKDAEAASAAISQGGGIVSLFAATPLPGQSQGNTFQAVSFNLNILV